MREIKFRAWDKENKKMIYDIIQYFIKEDELNGCDGYVLDFAGWLEHYPVMQYTGLKDKNGREIYEEDIIKNECGAYGLITWLDDKASIGITQGWCHPIYGNPSPTESEIIGNIYENPELLKGE